MATFKKGGISRGAGAAKKGFEYQIYKEGGGVKMAGGGSCRGMGAATKGGKYTIK